MVFQTILTLTLGIRIMGLAFFMVCQRKKCCSTPIFCHCTSGFKLISLAFASSKIPILTKKKISKLWQWLTYGSNPLNVCGSLVQEKSQWCIGNEIKLEIQDMSVPALIASVWCYNLGVLLLNICNFEYQFCLVLSDIFKLLSHFLKALWCSGIP